MWAFDRIKEILRDKVVDGGIEWLWQNAWVIATVAGLSYLIAYVRDLPLVFLIPLSLVVFNGLAWGIIGVCRIKQYWIPSVIPLRLAAQIAYDETHGKTYETIAKVSARDGVTILQVYAGVICQRVPVEAQKPGARRWHPIPEAVRKRLYVVDDACNSLKELSETSAAYVEPRVRKADLMAAIAFMRTFTIWNDA